MDLQTLRAMGLVQSNPLVKRTFKVKYRPLLPKDQWKDPTVEERQDDLTEGEVTVYLKRLTAADQLDVARAIREKREYWWMVFHRTVFTETGAPVFATEEEAAGVDLAMFKGLIDQINALNTPAKKSKPGTKSGVN